MRHAWMVRLVIAMAAGGQVFAAEPAEEPATGPELMICDFDAAPPNALGGQWGVFARSGEEKLFVVRDMHEEKFKVGEKGMSMRLEYNVEAKDTFNGFYIKMGPKERENKFNAAEYKKLVFWMMGDKRAGIPRAVKIELKGDSEDTSGSIYLTGIKSEWKEFSIPLGKFEAQGADCEAINEVVFVFENSQAAPKTKGRIWIDQVSLRK